MIALRLLRDLLVILVVLPLLVSGADWPQFLGPGANNLSTETGLLSQWPGGGPRVRWSKAVGTGYSAPSVRGGTLVLHHRVNDEEIVEAMESTTGKSRWRHAYPSHFVDPYGYNNGPRCTPLLTSNRCYTFGAEGRLACLDLDSGKCIWERDTSRDWNIPPAFFGVGSTPVLEGGRLITMIGGMPNSGMVALDANTGRTLWEGVGETTWQGKPKTGWPGEPPVKWSSEDKQASYSSPIAATIHGQRHVFCLMRQGLVSLNPTNGLVNFAFWFRAAVPESVNAAAPVIVDDLVLISAAYYRVGSVLLRVKPDGRSAEEVWRGTSLELHWNTPVHHQGFLYGFSGRNEPDARFRCVELKTGKVLWDRDERWNHYSTKQPPVYGRGSAIMADGKLIVLGEGGLLGLFEVNAREPRELARWQVPELHYPSWAGPVLSNRKLYLRSENRLVCFELGKE
jgi:outer membrane protein assembly factor BamB